MTAPVESGQGRTWCGLMPKVEARIRSLLKKFEYNRKAYQTDGSTAHYDMEMTYAVSDIAELILSEPAVIRDDARRPEGEDGRRKRVLKIVTSCVGMMGGDDLFQKLDRKTDAILALFPATTPPDALPAGEGPATMSEDSWHRIRTSVIPRVPTLDDWGWLRREWPRLIAEITALRLARSRTPETGEKTNG